MHSWSPLNERQLALLKRIGNGTDPVTSENPDVAHSARALRDRGLITMPRSAGKWRAEMTDAGRFYLENGHHPDRPLLRARPPRKAAGAGAARAAETAPAEEAPLPLRARPPRRVTAHKPAPNSGAAVAPPATVQEEPPTAKAALKLQVRESPIDAGRALVAEVLKAGGLLRITDPPQEVRARYRRGIDAARRLNCVPEGQHLRHTGRAEGDLAVGLFDDVNPDETSWNRIRLERVRSERRRVPVDIEEVITALEGDTTAFEVSAELVPRILDFLRAIGADASAHGGQVKVRKRRQHPHPLLSLHGAEYELRFREGEKQEQYIPTANDRRKVYGWQRVKPASRTVPSGELALEVGLGSYGWKHQWADTPKKPLEEQIKAIFRKLHERHQEAEKARIAAAEEHDRWVQERRREEDEQRRKWEAALASAQVKALAAERVSRFGTALEQWHDAMQVREFCDTLDTAAEHAEDPAEAARLRQWAQWGREQADQLDPTHPGGGLRALDFDLVPSDDMLRPFLDGWSPRQPQKEYRRPDPEQQHPGASPDLYGTLTRSAWRPGPQGHAQWWRR